MSFDNRVFDINGETKEQLRLAMQLAFTLHGDKAQAKAWTYTKEKGLIFCWYGGGSLTPFPTPLSHEECTEIAWKWLQSDTAQAMELGEFFEDADHDGHNGEGWRLYLERWGHVGEVRNSIVAVHPSYLWYGK